MEKRDFWSVPLKIYTDEVFNISYIKVLGENIFESIKIPTTLDRCKSRHLLNPNYLLHIEVIKTRKNWIFKNVLEYRQLMKPNSYQDYLKQAQLVNIILKHIHEGEETDLLSWVEDYFKNHILAQIELRAFENELMKQLGFK